MRFVFSLVWLFAACVCYGSVSANAQFVPPIADVGIPLVNLASVLFNNGSSSTYSGVLLYNVANQQALKIQQNTGSQGLFVFESLSSAASDINAQFVLAPATCSLSSCSPLAATAVVRPFSTQIVQIEGKAGVECTTSLNARVVQNWGGGDPIGQSVNSFCSPITHVGTNEGYYFVQVALDSENIVYQIRTWPHQHCVSALPANTANAFSMVLAQCAPTDTAQQWALYGHP